jgi:hypothetical protein
MPYSYQLAPIPRRSPAGNAGMGGESFIRSRREDWEGTFAIDWWGSTIAPARSCRC